TSPPACRSSTSSMRICGRSSTTIWAIRPPSKPPCRRWPIRARLCDRTSLLRSVPLVDLFPGGEPDARLLPHVVVDGLEVLDAVGRARDVRVDGERHHARVLRALGVQAVELIARALDP